MGKWGERWTPERVTEHQRRMGVEHRKNVELTALVHAMPIAKPIKVAKERKYRNRQTGKYASKREAKRAQELRLMQQAGTIRDLREQVKYTLIPRQNDENGKCIERPVTYCADFVYVDCVSGKSVVEDAKGMRTQQYILRRKMMLFLLKIRVKEV